MLKIDLMSIKNVWGQMHCSKSAGCLHSEPCLRMSAAKCVFKMSNVRNLCDVSAQMLYVCIYTYIYIYIWCLKRTARCNFKSQCCSNSEGYLGSDACCQYLLDIHVTSAARYVFDKHTSKYERYLVSEPCMNGEIDKPTRMSEARYTIRTLCVSNV